MTNHIINSINYVCMCTDALDVISHAQNVQSQRADKRICSKLLQQVSTYQKVKSLVLNLS